jgi:hypothetical protein
VLLWLSTLDGEQRLTMLLALKYAFSYLTSNREWAALIKQAGAELKLSAKQHEEIVLRAGRIASNLKEELAGA